MKHRYLSFVFLFLVNHPSFADKIIDIKVSTEMDISVERYQANGENLLLWIGPEYGVRPAHQKLARKLADAGHETWLIDLAESLFLPHNSQSMKKLDGSHIAYLITEAHRLTGKKILLMGSSYSSVQILRGVHKWQQQKLTSAYITGALLFSPNLYAGIPPLGMQPEYLPVVSATNIPVMIFQAGSNSNRWQLDNLTERLSSQNNPVYTKLYNGIVGLFYEKIVNPKQQEYFSQLHYDINRVITLLSRHTVPKYAATIKKTRDNTRTGLDINLKKYTATNKPVPIKLYDSYGKLFKKENFKDKVTIINFWATWCPPCVEEIPSLNRLSKKMNQKYFELISINYAEDQHTINDFLKKVKVHYPVLLDKNGEFAKEWNVLAYPSTFIIGPDGEIKYGVNAAIEWDTPEIITKLKQLYNP